MADDDWRGTDYEQVLTGTDKQKSYTFQTIGIWCMVIAIPTLIGLGVMIWGILPSTIAQFDQEYREVVLNRILWGCIIFDALSLLVVAILRAPGYPRD